MCTSLPHCKLLSSKNDIPKQLRQIDRRADIESIDEDFRVSHLTARGLDAQQRSIRNQYSFPTITTNTAHSIYEDEEGNLEGMIQDALSHVFKER